MHVGLNLMFLVPGATGGTEIYARELARALSSERPDIRLTAFINHETAAVPDSLWGSVVETVVLPVKVTNRLEWVRGEQILLPRAARRRGCDIVHSPANTGPVSGSFRRVQTVHDLLYRAVPESHFGIRGLGMRVLVPAAARRADRIITGSRASAEEIVQTLRLDQERVDVVHHGIGALRQVAPTPERVLRDRLGLGERRILLSVSTKRAHKNLVRLLDAVALIPAERRPLLVLPGYSTPHEGELRRHAALLGIEPDVRFEGWLAEPDLEGLYDAATAFVFATLYEGFGLPVLEAMARGLPVACSDIPVLREVVGQAAVMFNPLEPRSISMAIEGLMNDGLLRERLRAAGLVQAAGFSWARTARSVAATYERTLAGERGGV
jgi:glycosyltransferase involved in cell wall biosynthesis